MSFVYVEGYFSKLNVTVKAMHGYYETVITLAPNIQRQCHYKVTLLLLFWHLQMHCSGIRGLPVALTFQVSVRDILNSNMIFF